jgi:hypothetical protein
VLVHILLDKLQQYVGHVLTLGSGNGLEAVVQLEGDIQVHSFDQWFLSFRDVRSPPLSGGEFICL